MSFDIRELPLPRLLAVIFFFLVAWVIGVLWLGSFLYLWKIGQPRGLASPLLLFQYWTHYGHVPGVKFWVSACSGAAAVMLSIPFFALLMPQAKKLHGDAKLAKASDLAKEGMFDAGRTFMFMRFGRKIVFGPTADKAKNLKKMVSVMLAAPPRSGKGVSQVQTNMLTMDCSVIITDIRQESYQITSGYRALFTEVHVINPFPAKARDEKGKVKIDPATGEEIWESRTSQWNPISKLYVPEEQGLRINQLQKQASFLFPDPADGKDKFWAASSRSLFLGMALYVLESDDKPHTIGQILREAQSGGDTGDSISEYWAGIITAREKAGKPLSSACVQSLRDFISTGGNTLTSIRKSLTAALDLWQNPIVDAMTSGDSFDLRDLRKKKMTIYLGVSPDNLARASVLLSLFLQQAMDVNMQEMPADNDKIKHPLALLLDEIPALGRMEVLAKSIGYLNGYWIIPYFIFQSFAQLRGVYGREDSAAMIDCCQIKMAFPPKSQEEAELLSKEIGYITEKAKSVSTGRGLLNDNAGSTSTSLTQRALLLPQEIKALGKDAVILLAEGMPPAIGKKIYFYKEPEFKKRLMPPHPIPMLDYQAILKLSEQALTPPEPEPEPEPTTDFSAVAAANVQPDFGVITPPVAPAVASPDDFDDIFSTPAADMPENTDSRFQDVFDEPDSSTSESETVALSDEDLKELFENAVSSTEEKIPGSLTVPLSVQDYEITLEEVLQLALEGTAEEIEITPSLLPVVEELELSDLMQDFSDTDIPQDSILTDEDLENMLSGFFGKLPTAA